MDILHLAAPCRNVPVTFTLDSMKTSRPLLLAWAAVKGFFWPVLIAGAIVAYGVWGPVQPPKSWTDGAKTFFAALFFIMYFYTQYKRVEKQTDDKESFRGVNEKLVSLEELVKQLRAPSTAAEPAGAAPSQPAGTRDASSLLVESRDLLSKNHTLAALLQGGVAFEHALRAFARRFNQEQADSSNLHDLLRRLELVLPKELVSEMHALRMIRNRMTHISEHELSDLPNADRILSGYEWAVDQLGRLERSEHAV